MKRNGWMILVLMLVCLRGFPLEFDAKNPNYNYLNKLVLECLNAKRAKRSASQLKFHAALQKTAEYYTDHFVLRKFESNAENKLRISKKIKKMCQQNGFTTRLTDFSINTCSAVNFYGSKFYYEQDDSTNSLHLYVGKKRPSKKEKEKEGFSSIPVKNFTYEELAEEIAKKFSRDRGHIKSLNKGYDQIGISCVVEPRSLGGRKLPKIKAIIIVGGKLINW
jgi:hypothetical protein